MARLLASETSLERKREQMRVAKASYEALQKRLEEETRRREAAERALENSAKNSKSRLDVSDSPNDEHATKTKHLLRDVLALVAHACGVTGRADSRRSPRRSPRIGGAGARRAGRVGARIAHGDARLGAHHRRVRDARGRCRGRGECLRDARRARRRRAHRREGETPSEKRRFPNRRARGSVRRDEKLARVVSRALAKHRSSPEACACACDLMRALASERDEISENLTSELVRLESASGAVGAAEWHPSDEDVVLGGARYRVDGRARDGA